MCILRLWIFIAAEVDSIFSCGAEKRLQLIIRNRNAERLSEFFDQCIRILTFFKTVCKLFRKARLLAFVIEKHKIDGFCLFCPSAQISFGKRFFDFGKDCLHSFIFSLLGLGHPACDTFEEIFCIFAFSEKFA